MAIDITEKTISMVKKVTFDWKLTAGTTGGTTTKIYDGELLRVHCPATTCTSCGYAVTLSDSNGGDLLGGQGAFVTNSADFGTSTGGSLSYPLSAVNGTLTLLVVDTSGASVSSGKTVAYIR